MFANTEEQYGFSSSQRISEPFPSCVTCAEPRGKPRPCCLYHRIIEYPQLEGTHEDHQSPAILAVHLVIIFQWGYNSNKKYLFHFFRKALKRAPVQLELQWLCKGMHSLTAGLSSYVFYVEQAQESFPEA